MTATLKGLEPSAFTSRHVLRSAFDNCQRREQYSANVGYGVKECEWVWNELDFAFVIRRSARLKLQSSIIFMSGRTRTVGLTSVKSQGLRGYPRNLQ